MSNHNDNLYQRFIRATKHILNPQKETQRVLDKLEGDSVRLRRLKEELDASMHWQEQYSFVLNTMTTAMSALVWRKDKNNRYLLASPLHCKNFFGITATSECLEFINGKTDEEIIKALYTDAFIQNTFGKTCTLTDDYVRGQKKICHFLEGGVVDGEQVLLYVIKTPEMNDCECVGTVGMAWDFTEQSGFMIRLLNRWIKDEKAVELHREKDVFAYAVEPEARKCDIFKHVCPNPEKNTGCNHIYVEDPCYMRESDGVANKVHETKSPFFVIQSNGGCNG